MHDALILSLAFVLAQPAQFDAKFHDGSHVVISLAQPSLDVQTRYGLLTVPLEDVRRVEFGSHVPAEAVKRLAMAVKRLGSDGREKADATAEVIAGGHWSIPALNAAMSSPDRAYAGYCERVRHKIEQGTPAAMMSLGETDTVRTKTFPIVGRITSDTIKAHSSLFGFISLTFHPSRFAKTQVVILYRHFTNSTTRQPSPHLMYRHTPSVSRM